MATPVRTKPDSSMPVMTLPVRVRPYSLPASVPSPLRWPLPRLNHSHNVATMWSALGDIIGSLLKQTGQSKAQALSCASSSTESAETLPLPLSPFLQQRPKDLSDILAGVDGEGKPLKMGRFLPPQKTKMGWYKVPCSVFDYAPTTLDPSLMELGSKEPEAGSLPTAQVIKFERDARTVSLIGSFLDMAVASSRKIITETMAREDMP